MIKKKKQFIAILIFAGLILILLLVLPGLVKNYAVNNSKELAGRQFNIEDLKYNYFTSTVEIYDFKILEQNGQDNFITFDTLMVNLEPLKLFKDKIEIEDFYIKGLEVNVIMKDSTFNFDDLIAFHTKLEDSTSQNTEEDSFKFSISNINIEESDFHFNNKDIDHITNIENLSFQVPFIGWDQEKKSNSDVKFNFPRGGYFESKLNINPINGEYDASITINDLYLDPFYKYVAVYADINSFEGRLNSQIIIEGNINEAVNSIISGHVQVDDFLMTDKNNKTFLSAKNINSNLKRIDYANNSYILDSLNINNSYAYFQLDSVSNNFSEIFNPNTVPDTIKSENTRQVKDSTYMESDIKSELYYAINHFNSNKGVLDFTENSTKVPVNYLFNEINISSENIASDAKWIEINSNMIFNNQSPLKSTLGLNPISGEYDASITISDLQLDLFYKYAVEFADINSFEGKLTSQISSIGNFNEVMNSIISGQVELHDFQMTDKSDKVFLSAKNITTNLKKIDYANNSYIIESLDIHKSYTYFQMDSITNNFIKIFNPNTSTNPIASKNTKQSKGSTNTNSEKETKLYYAVNRINIEKGVLDYSDNLTGIPFNYHLSEIEIKSDNIVSDANWITINSNMILNNRGTLIAELGFNPTNYNNLNLDFSIEKFLLSDINIYTDYYMGHNILEGDMFYQSNSKITNGSIESENNLLIKNVSIDNTEKGLYNLPLKFALFLLKDKNGDVNLDIPVRGDINDPTVNVKKLVWSTFKNLIIKAAASPGKLLAGLVGGDPKDLEEITFKYVDTIPSDKNKKQLDLLIDLEQKKKDLKIELVYYVDEQLQKEAIAKSEAGKMYFEETQKDYLKDSKDFESFLLRKTFPDSLAIKKSTMKIANPKIVDSIAINNSQLLISNTTKYLQMASDSTQIKIIRSRPEEPENVGSYPLFKLNFSMKSEIDATTEN